MLAERLGDVVHLDHDAPVERARGVVGRRLGHLGQAVDVVAARVVRGVGAGLGVTDIDVDDRRHLGAARVVGEGAPVDVHARRQLGADLRQRAGDREQRPIRLAHAVARQALQQADRVRVLRRLEHLDGVALLDDLAGVHHPDPVAHRADDAEVVGDQQDRRVGLAAQRAHEVEHLGLDRGVEPGGRLVEHEQLGVARQGHGDDDTLLHAAGELVRVALHDPVGVGDAHPAQGSPGVLDGVLAVAPRGWRTPRRPGGRSAPSGSARRRDPGTPSTPRAPGSGAGPCRPSPSRPGRRRGCGPR